MFGSGKPVDEDRLLVDFQRTIGYTFKDCALLRVALTHRSFAKSGESDWLPSNERLEFLGDSVLGLIVAESLYTDYPQKTEGGLTKLKSLLVNETTLFRTSTSMDLGRFILLSPEEERAGGRQRASINADTLEAIIGALFLDGGLRVAKTFITRHILAHTEEIAADETYRNYKGDLLEYLQGKGAGMPRYEVVNESGPDHDKVFDVVVYSNGRQVGSGTGSCKKDAEQQAAAEALLRLKVE